MRLWAGALALMLGLTACKHAGTGLSPNWVGPRAPKGVETVDEAVDGLTVGHRMMAAGEFELALRAYTRAAGEQGLNADVLSAMGSANLKLGRLKQAKKLLEAAVEKDPEFVPAWNNLGVVLMEMGEIGQAGRVFRNAYALDNGNSEEIRENLRLAIAKTENKEYAPSEEHNFELVRRGKGEYLLLKTPDS